MNPRFLAYARSRGETPEETLAHDEHRYPGGKMTGFMAWISARWAEWHAERGHYSPILTEDDHRDFDEWLNGRAERMKTRYRIECIDNDRRGGHDCAPHEMINGVCGVCREKESAR